jgi:hypothetical protein
MRFLYFYVSCIFCFILGFIFNTNWCQLMGCNELYKADWYTIGVIILIMILFPINAYLNITKR